MFRREEDKYLIYLPVGLAEDSIFPFPLKNDSEMYVKLSFKLGKDFLLVERWNKAPENG